MGASFSWQIDYFDFIYDIGSIAFWGLPQRPGRRQSKKHPGALSIPNSDKSFKNLVAGMCLYPFFNIVLTRYPGTGTSHHCLF
jgi:hypothetical protein